jgi:hypothetical protein
VGLSQVRQTVECLGRGGKIPCGSEASSLVGSSRLTVCHVSLVFFSWFALFRAPKLGDVHSSDLTIMLS